MLTPKDVSDRKPTLTIAFADFWTGFDPEENVFIDALRAEYDVKIGAKPDVLIFSCYGAEHRRYKCPRIFYTPENLRPDFTNCDFAITFDHLRNARHLRYPLFALYAEKYQWWESLIRCDAQQRIDEWQSRKKFCCMVVSNPRSRRRLDFYERLSRHRRVDSGGKYLNNVGGPVVNKMEFLRDYRFVIAFENSSYPGYTTEKLIEPLVCGNIPIYWGNPEVACDFNTKRIVTCRTPVDDEQLIQTILEIDTNPDIAAKILSEPVFATTGIGENYYSELQQFLCSIISRLSEVRPVSVQPLRQALHFCKRSLGNVSYVKDVFLRRNFR